MLFSILVANYNNGNFFLEFYHSILQQTYSNWEVIIVDDNSTDGSVNIIRELIGGDNRFKLFLNGNNYGCGYTKKRCAELATGQICGFVDPDDTIVDNAVEVMINAHIKNPDVSLVHSNFNFCNEFLQKISTFGRAKSVEVNKRFTNLGANVNPFATFKKIFYERTEGIDASGKRAVDQDLYLKLSETGPFYFIDKPLYNYRIHKNGISTSKSDQAFYWFLKMIMKAEERRKINLEDEVAVYLNRYNPGNLEVNLANPRYLILAMIRAFKKKPAGFLRKLFFNR